MVRRTIQNSFCTSIRDSVVIVAAKSKKSAMIATKYTSIGYVISQNKMNTDRWLGESITMSFFDDLFSPPVEEDGICTVRGVNASFIDLPDTGAQGNNGWACGPNSAARCLRKYGHGVDFNSVMRDMEAGRYAIEKIDCLRIGSTPHYLRDSMKKWEGDRVKLERNSNLDRLVGLVREGKPVIALIRNGTIKSPFGKAPNLHWICVTGYDDRSGAVHITDTDGSKDWVVKDDFLRQWNWHVGAGAVAEALYHNGVYSSTIVWIDRKP